MNEALISIVIPIYKVEPYLDCCINSIVNQTYKNLEIILVDDGSPDNCPRMCENWSKKDQRIRVIHKSNGGLSSARNAGILAAHGVYIGFVDSDDYIAVDMYEKLFTAIKNNDADLAICSLIFIDEKGNNIEGISTSPIKNEMLNTQQALEKLNMTNSNYWYYVTAVNKLYKRELFDSVIFREGKLHEDEFAVHHFFNACSKIITIEDVLYFYVQHNCSIMTSPFTLKRLDAIEALWERYNFFEENRYAELANGTLIAAYGAIIRFMSKSETKIYKNEVKIWVKRIIRELIYQRNLRAIKLGIKFLQYLCKH